MILVVSGSFPLHETGVTSILDSFEDVRSPSISNDNTKLPNLVWWWSAGINENLCYKHHKSVLKDQ